MIKGSGNNRSHSIWWISSCLLLFLVSLLLTRPLAAQTETPDEIPTLEPIGQIGGMSWAMDVQGDHVYVGEGQRLVVLDVSNPSEPFRVGQSPILSGWVTDIAVRDNTAFVAALAGGLNVVDVSFPTSPVEISRYKPEEFLPVALEMVDNFAYLLGFIPEAASSDSYIEMRIVDVTNPLKPIELGRYGPYETESFIPQISIDGEYAYLVADNGNIHVVDVSDPYAPRQVAIEAITDERLEMWIGEGIAYIREDDYNSVRMFRIDNVNVFTEIGSLQMPGEINYIETSDNLAFFGGEYKESDDALSYICVLDVSDPVTPVEKGCHLSKMIINPWRIEFADNRLYIRDHTHGLAIVSFEELSYPKELGYGAFGIGQIDQVEVIDSIAYVQTREYSRESRRDYSKILMIDLTNPEDPVEIGYFDAPEYVRIVSIFDGLIYLKGQSDDLGQGGLYIVDVSFPSSPLQIGFFDSPDDVYSAIIHDDIAYLSGSSYSINDEKGLRLVDVSNPSVPVQIGFFPQQEINYFASITLINDIAYLGLRDGDFQLVDVSIPSAPEEVGSIETNGRPSHISVEGSFFYYIDDAPGIKVVDVSSPAEPVESTEIETVGEPRIANVDNHILYYQDDNPGLHRIDLTNHEKPIHLETLPVDGRILTMKNQMALVIELDGLNYRLRLLDITDPETEKDSRYFGLCRSSTEISDFSDAYVFLVDYFCGLIIWKNEFGTMSPGIDLLQEETSIPAEDSTPQAEDVVKTTEPEIAVADEPEAAAPVNEPTSEPTAVQPTITDPEPAQLEIQTDSNLLFIAVGVGVGLSLAALAVAVFVLIRRRPAQQPVQPVSTDQRHCMHCGAELPATGKFCIKCGEGF